MALWDVAVFPPKTSGANVTTPPSSTFQSKLRRKEGMRKRDIGGDGENESVGMCVCMWEKG